MEVRTKLFTVVATSVILGSLYSPIATAEEEIITLQDILDAILGVNNRLDDIEDRVSQLEVIREETVTNTDQTIQDVFEQAEIGVEHWWSRFIDDQYFRLNQEVEAYAVQYRFMCNIHKDRNKRSNILMHYAKILASPTYGSVVTTMSARKMIKDKANI